MNHSRLTPPPHIRREVTALSRRLKKATEKHGATLTHQQCRDVLAQTLGYRSDHAMMQDLAKSTSTDLDAKSTVSGKQVKLSYAGTTYIWKVKVRGKENAPCEVICGPSGAGKTTYLSARAKASPNAILVLGSTDLEKSEFPNSFKPDKQWQKVKEPGDLQQPGHLMYVLPEPELLQNDDHLDMLRSILKFPGLVCLDEIVLPHLPQLWYDIHRRQKEPTLLVMRLREAEFKDAKLLPEFLFSKQQLILRL